MTPTRPFPALVRSFSWPIALKVASKDFAVSPDATEDVDDEDDELPPPPHAARTTATALTHAVRVRRLTLPTCIRIAPRVEQVPSGRDLLTDVFMPVDPDPAPRSKLSSFWGRRYACSRQHGPMPMR